MDNASNMMLPIRGIRINWDKIGSDSYLRKIPAISGLEEYLFEKNITFFVGENGSGKSTLLEAIAIAYGFNPEGGTINYSFSTYDSHSELFEAMGLIKGVKKAKWGYFLRAESIYNVASAEQEYNESWGCSEYYHQKSHGESFLAIAQKNFKEGGLYLLDEPEAALSPQRQMTLLIDIVRCARGGAQFFIATHSPILLGIPDAQILSFDGDKIHLCTYMETDSYKVTAMFINNREQVLRSLLD